MKYASWIGILAALSTASVIAAPTDLPTGGAVAAGSAAIGTAGSVMTVTSSSTRAVLTWNTFNIGSATQVNFAQPSSGSAVLNRVTGSDVSQLFGTISSNGSVFLLNPNGVIMGSSTQFNLPSITINTATNTPSDASFMSGAVSGFNTPTSTGGDIGGGFNASGDITLAIGGNSNFSGTLIAGGALTISNFTPTCVGSCQIGSFDPGVISGSGNIVIQSSPSAIVNWGSFSIPNGQTGNFVQPNPSATLNPVNATPVPTALLLNGSVTLISPGGNISIGGSINLGNPLAGQGASALSLTGQSLQSGNGGGNLTISNTTAQNLIEKGQFKTSGGETQITTQGAVEIMNSLINTGNLTNATTMTVNGNTVSIGL